MFLEPCTQAPLSFAIVTLEAVKVSRLAQVSRFVIRIGLLVMDRSELKSGLLRTSSPVKNACRIFESVSRGAKNVPFSRDAMGNSKEMSAEMKVMEVWNRANPKYRSVLCWPLFSYVATIRSYCRFSRFRVAYKCMETGDLVVNYVGETVSAC